MRTVKMKTIYAGPNGSCQPDGSITVDDEEAKQLVDGGYGEYIDITEAITEEASEESTEEQPIDDDGKEASNEGGSDSDVNHETTADVINEQKVNDDTPVNAEQNPA